MVAVPPSWIAWRIRNELLLTEPKYETQLRPVSLLKAAASAGANSRLHTRAGLSSEAAVHCSIHSLGVDASRTAADVGAVCCRPAMIAIAPTVATAISVRERRRGHCPSSSGRGSSTGTGGCGAKPSRGCIGPDVAAVGA